MTLEQLIELYNRVYGVSNPKLQFLEYSTILTDKGTYEGVLALPQMDWDVFKWTYSNSVLHFFNEKAVIYVVLDGDITFQFVSSQFVHLCSLIGFMEGCHEFQGKEVINVFFANAELNAGVNVTSEDTSVAQYVNIIDPNKGAWDGTVDSNYSKLEITDYRRSTPVLLIQYDNSVKMW